MNHPTPTERLLIRQVIGDPVFTAEFYTTPEGVTYLHGQGRHIEAVLASHLREQPI